MKKQFTKRKSFYLNSEGSEALADIGGNMWKHRKNVSPPTQTDIVRLAIIWQERLLEIREDEARERAKAYKSYKAVPKGNSRITVNLTSSNIEKLKKIQRFITGTNQHNTTASDVITFALQGVASFPPLGYMLP